LLQKIKDEPQLTLFAQYLKITGLDTILTRIQQYTVWAPTNKALYSMDSTIANDTAKLRAIISNHFCLQAYPYNLSADTVAVKMYSGKSIVLINSLKQIEGANYISSDNICSNGILHIVDKVLLPKDNIWEIIQSLDCVPSLSNYINSQENRLYFDALVSTVIGTDPTTGGLAYDSVKYNKFLFDVAPMQREDSVYTFFAITDDVFTSEYVKYTPYCKGPTASATDSMTNVCVVKDLAVRGRYLKNQLPDTLVSVNGVKIHVDKSAIIKTYEASNGIVHVINKLDVKLRNKLLPVIIEGESASIWSGVNTNDSYYFFNFNSEASAGMYMYWYFTGNRGTYYLGYYDDNATNRARLNLFSTSYSVYYRVLNINNSKFVGYTTYLNINTTYGNFINRGRLNRYDYRCWTDLEYDSNYSKFREVELSDYAFTLRNVKNLYLSLFAHANTQASAGLIFDYIKLVPNIQ
jgi:uncharacterized surface protein with fasciclin (FAS1) repeats